MLPNNIKISLRNYRKNKFYSTLTITSLAVGICAVLLIYIYVSFEFSYDDFHKEKDQLFRVSIISSIKGKTDSESPVFLEPLAPAMKREIPEIDEYARVSNVKNGIISYKEKEVKIDGVRFADSTFFNVFSFDLLVGDKKKVLEKPSTAVITKETAKTLFGSENPIGKEITFNNDSYEITGITADTPFNTHLRFNMLLSFESLFNNPKVHLGWNGGNQYISYVKLKVGTLGQSVEKKLENLLWNYLNKDMAAIGWKVKGYLQQVQNIHVYYDDTNRTRVANLQIFSVTALFILLIACINYINLTLAQSIKRSKEIGVKKVFGASRIILAKQFLLESLITIIISSTLAFLIFLLISQIYKEFVGELFKTELLFNYRNIIAFLVMMIFVSFVSSLYPAFYLSKLSPIRTIQENKFQRISKFSLRNALIVLQFVISICLISSTIIIVRQLNFIKQRDTGFQKDNLIILKLNGPESKRNYSLIKNELVKIAAVKSVTASSNIPVGGLTSNGYIPEGSPAPNLINVLDVDNNFLDTYGIKLISGRNFSENPIEDKASYLINEEFVKQYGWINPIGKTIDRNGKHHVIGVVSNFNYSTAYEKISPLIITNNPESEEFYYLSIKTSSTGIIETVERIKNVYQKINSGAAPEYFFIAEAVDLSYKDEINFRTLLLYFSALSISLAVIGLLGLASFTLTQKKKEIGIRKVLGSSGMQIVVLTCREYCLIVLAASLIAFVPTYYFMSGWLEDFVYKIDIEAWIFLLSGTIALVISLITISIQIIKAAIANPVDSLKYE